MALSARKRKALEAEGWKFGRVQDLLELTDEEGALIEVKVTLARALKALRQKKRLTQTALARLIGSNQSRIARMERGDASLDLMVKGLLALGATRREIGKKLQEAA